MMGKGDVPRPLNYNSIYWDYMIAKGAAPMKKQSGFTLLEIIVVIAIIAAIAAIAIPVYRNYLVRAHSAEIIEDYEAVKKEMSLAYDGTGDCAALVGKIEPKFLQNKYTSLDIGFEKTPDGFVPFFKVCSDVGNYGKLGVDVAEAAHKAFVNIGEMSKGAVVGQALVTFAAPLVSQNTTVCNSYTPPPTAGSGCGGGSKPQVAQAPAPAPKPAPAKPAALPKVTTDGITCKDWEYAEGKNCRLKPEYVNLTITKKPSMADNPCPDGYYFHPNDGQAYSGGSQDGQCVSAGNHQDPYESVKCHVCRPGAPPKICESLHMEVECQYPNNFCVNYVTNLDTGGRSIIRRCGNRLEATKEWYEGYSDSDRCQNFDPQYVHTLDFECLFACVEDGCNEGANPLFTARDSMWRP